MHMLSAMLLWVARSFPRRACSETHAGGTRARSGLGSCVHTMHIHADFHHFDTLFTLRACACSASCVHPLKRYFLVRSATPAWVTGTPHTRACSMRTSHGHVPMQKWEPSSCILARTIGSSCVCVHRAAHAIGGRMHWLKIKCEALGPGASDEKFSCACM